jgi:HEPN domain-containing protein
MHKRDFEAFAQAKIDDAILLLENERYSNAFYLAGYSLELALKACISSQFSANDIPDPKFVKEIYTHDLTQLVRLAGLRPLHEQEIKRNPDFASNWGIVSEWSEASRYESMAAGDAQLLIAAITDSNNGVFPWIKKHW